MNIEDKVSSEIKDILENNGYDLVSVLYEKEANAYFLRVVIDKEGYINLEDCVKATYLISPITDDIQGLDDNYMLEVSSKEKGSDYNG